MALSALSSSSSLTAAAAVIVASSCVDTVVEIGDAPAFAVDSAVGETGISHFCVKSRYMNAIFWEKNYAGGR